MPRYDRMVELASCLCAQIETDGSPQPCFCGVIPGVGVAADYAGDCKEKCGMAWVRLVGVAPMKGVGNIDLTPGNCNTELGNTIELGILRCIEIPTQRNPITPPSVLAAATQQQVKDMETMHRAVVCCSSFPNNSYLFQGYTPIGPQGGLVGGTWNLVVV